MAIQAPQVVGGVTTVGGSSASSTITLARPSGVQTDDLLVAVLRTNGATSPSDFTLAGWERVGAPFTPNDSGIRVTGMYIHRVTNPGAEPAQYVFAKTVADSRQAGAMFTLRGVALASPVTGETEGGIADAQPTIAMKSITTDTSDPQLLVYVWATEITSPNATEPTATPVDGTQIALVPSRTGATATRSTIWVGAEIVAASAVPQKYLTWTSVSGSDVTAATFRGIEGTTPPETSDVTFQLRRGTTAEWEGTNPVLAQGEPGVDLTTGELKIGDGATQWGDLTGITGGTSSVLVVDDINTIPPGTPAGTVLFEAD